jgi:flagellar basal-body rod modification protein FlgD
MDPIQGTTGPFGGPDLTRLANDQVDKEQFLRLLVTQLRNQDPLEPTKNEEFLAQLATFSALEQQQITNEGLATLVGLTQAQLTLGGLSQAASLVGREVTWIDDLGAEQRGTVTRVSFDARGVFAEIDGQMVPAGSIVAVHAPGGGSSTTGGGTPDPGAGSTPPNATFPTEDTASSATN